MTTIPQPTEVRAAQFRALQALGSTANPERQRPKEARRAGYELICGRTSLHSRALAALAQALKQPPERALRPAHRSPGRVGMAVCPLPTCVCAPPPNVTIVLHLDAIPAVRQHGRDKKGPSPAPTPADARRVRAPKRVQRPTRPSPPSSPRSRRSP